MPQTQPGQFNVYVPSHDATNKLTIDFARNVKDFGVNRYTQIQPVKVPRGYYLQFLVEEAGRVIYTDARDSAWPDGNDAPKGIGDTEAFEWKEYRAQRRAKAFTLGDLTTDSASWDIVAQHSSIKARQMMTIRTQLAVNALTTTTNYDSTHRLDVTAISGNTGNWANSTTARGDIKRSLHVAMEVILDDTLAAVKQGDLMLVINSTLAREMAESQEIVDYIKGSPDALAQIKGELPGTNVMYGLPDMLWGFKVEVEPTRKVTTLKGHTTARSQILATATPFICSRPGALEAPAGTPSFSTCTMMALEEMTVETKRDSDNRRTTGRVVENYQFVMTAAASGVLFSNAG